MSEDLINNIKKNKENFESCVSTLNDEIKNKVDIFFIDYNNYDSPIPTEQQTNLTINNIILLISEEKDKILSILYY